MAGKSHDNQIANMRPYILSLMKKEARDFRQCELCPAAIPDGQYEIHHTRYNGATYYDLRIVCRSCNKKADNCLLS